SKRATNGGKLGLAHALFNATVRFQGIRDRLSLAGHRAEEQQNDGHDEHSDDAEQNEEDPPAAPNATGSVDNEPRLVGEPDFITTVDRLIEELREFGIQWPSRHGTILNATVGGFEGVAPGA